VSITRVAGKTKVIKKKNFWNALDGGCLEVILLHCDQLDATWISLYSEQGEQGMF
jgi:hypothetical protein